MKEVESLPNLQAYRQYVLLNYTGDGGQDRYVKDRRHFFDRELENKTFGIRGLEETAMPISEQRAVQTRPDRVQRQIRGAQTNRIPLVRSLIRSFRTILSETTSQ